ncbi:CPBP family intramembrane metalloprotease [Spirosoma sp. BT702]|uniref:CPBP family intramembrane metalloprotease n=1 Tax=Spirosoma profusum TaxID=2771354 RepID=A0A926Y3I7_9BACT|nr:CPBP family intramembrane glutamic endopeptidase [Spirosoma profusum]MBD2701945.1 CPBP family intramembrane metalloprotease [Spirosoma profusum]
MATLINQAISAVLQVALFTLIPFLFFLFRRNKQITFGQYIGFYNPTRKSMQYTFATLLLFLAVGVGFAFLDDGIRQAVTSPKSVTGQLRQMGFSVESVTTLLLIALIKTSLSEEIFFRGFIAKRLIASLGFNVGNVAQAVIFGLVHLLLFWLIVKSSPFTLVFFFLFSGFAGWLIGYIKEKFANGSIIPGWMAHGLGNTLSYAIIAFLL